MSDAEPDHSALTWAQPVGLVLAGGNARRMGGGDKGRLDLAGETLIERVIARFAPQVAALALSANGDPARFADLHLPVLTDTVLDAGPLAGILAGLQWAAEQGATHIVTAAADTPFLPPDLVPRLLLAAETAGAPIALAATPDETGRPRRHPTFGLWPVALREELRDALKSGTRKLGLWAEQQGAALAVFPADPFDPFFNVNTPADLETAQRLLG